MFWVKLIDQSHKHLQTVPALQNQNLLQLLNHCGHFFPTNCGSKGKCGKCKVEIEDPSTGNRKEVLSCQYSISKSIHVVLPASNNNQKLSSTTLNHRRPLQKKVFRKKTFQLQNEGSVLSQIETIARKKLINTKGFIDSIPSKFYRKQELEYWSTRSKIWQCTSNQSAYVILMDLGTTAINTEIINIETNERFFDVTLNPQVQFGSDVITRIDRIISDKESLHTMQKQIYTALEELLSQHDIQPNQIVALFTAGNTTMQQIFSGNSPESLGYAPNIPITSGNNYIYQNPWISYTFPIIDAFLGGDLFADLYGLKARSIDNFLLIDLGTNGEIALSTDESIYCCSCAAGPAFEGGNIELGSPAFPGALCSINNDHFQTIGDAPPKTICGSGLIDLIHQAYRDGILNRAGDIKTGDTHYFRGKDYRLTYKPCPQIYLTQRDIRAFQNAKSAIHTGISSLLKRSDILPQEIIIAGGFTEHLNPEALFALGILPRSLQGLPIHMSGNLCLHGLEYYYENLNTSQDKQFSLIKKQCRPILLTEEPDFEDTFADSMFFGPKCAE